MNGLELKLRRIAAEVRTKELALAMGVHPSQITRTEASRKVTPEMGSRYLAALATCTTKSTEVA